MGRVQGLKPAEPSRSTDPPCPQARCQTRLPPRQYFAFRRIKGCDRTPTPYRHTSTLTAWPSCPGELGLTEHGLRLIGHKRYPICEGSSEDRDPEEVFDIPGAREKSKHHAQ